MGPTFRSLLATGFCKLMKAFEYETVNPEQEMSGSEVKRERERGLEAGSRAV